MADKDLDESLTNTPADEQKAIKALAVQLFPKIVAKYQLATNPDGTAGNPEDVFDFFKHVVSGRGTRSFLTYHNDTYVVACTDYVEDMNEGIDQLLVLLLWAAGESRYGGRRKDVREYALGEAEKEDVPSTNDVGWVGRDLE